MPIADRSVHLETMAVAFASTKSRLSLPYISTCILNGKLHSFEKASPTLPYDLATNLSEMQTYCTCMHPSEFNALRVIFSSIALVRLNSRGLSQVEIARRIRRSPVTNEMRGRCLN